MPSSRPTRQPIHHAPSASYSFTMRVRLPSVPGMFARLAGIIGKAGGDLGAIDMVSGDRKQTLRDVTVSAEDDAHAQRIIAAVHAAPQFEVRAVSDRTFLLHLGGKITVENKTPLKTRDDLSMAYTPGVARVCLAIEREPKSAWSLTIKGSTVAIVTDGTAVLGLGDIGPEAAMPVMEGKAMLFAMANPTPEVTPQSVPPNVAIIATGRSDYPNQINNVLCFPGIFKGALASHAREINESMKLAAARAIASVVKREELSTDYIIPSVFDRRVATAVAKAVAAAAVKSGVARRVQTSGDARIGGRMHRR